MKKKEYTVPSRSQPIFTPIKKILGIFYGRPEIVDLSGGVSDKAIILMNHSGKGGPMAMEIFFPKFNVKWGAHEMMEGFRSRRRYLRDVYYIRKRGYNRFIATLAATFEAIFSGMIYKGMKFIPTYRDMRFKKTIEDSVKVLDASAAITVFPEKSDDGYKEMLSGFDPGFILLSETYFKKTGEDVPLYPVYYHLKKRKMVIGKPEYLQEVKKTVKGRNEICDHFCSLVNCLYLDYIKE